MAIYSLANRTSNGTSAAATLELRTASAVRATVLEFGISINAGPASAFGFGRPAAIGITPTTPVTVLQEDAGAPNGNSQTALAWGTGPTVPTQFFRRVSLPNVVGAGIIWTFPRGIIVPVSNSVVLWNLSATAVIDTWIVLDE